MLHPAKTSNQVTARASVATARRGSLPLLITGDEQLLDDISRLAATAGSTIDVASDAAGARSRWPHAPLVIVGRDQAQAIVALSPPRRSRVLLVDSEPSDESVWRCAVDIGAERVLHLPADETWVTDELTNAAEGDLAEGTTIGVVGGRGGAGASVFATALADVGHRANRTATLIDFDLLGGGLDLLLGTEQAAGLRWPDLAPTRGRLSGQTLLSHLPSRGGLTVVSCDRRDLTAIPPDAAQAVVSAARRASDLVVLDLPRQLDSAAERALADVSCIALVVPTEVRAVAAAARVAATLTTFVSDVQVVARRTSRALSSADVAAALELPLAIELEPEPRLGERIERGEALCADIGGPLASVCLRFLEEIQPEFGVRAA